MEDVTQSTVSTSQHAAPEKTSDRSYVACRATIFELTSQQANDKKLRKNPKSLDLRFTGTGSSMISTMIKSLVQSNKNNFNYPNEIQKIVNDAYFFP